MSVTTSQQVNADQLQAALVALAPGASFSSSGGVLATTDAKTFTFYGATDGQGQSALTAAASSYVNYTANQATVNANILARQAQIQAWLTANPNGAVLTAAQTRTLALMLNGLCQLLLQQYGSTTNT